MTEEIIIAAISAGFPTVATIVTAKIQARAADKNSAKHSILQMILEDHMAVAEGKLPTNYQNILHDFDIYKKNGGNSYLADKIDDYKRWFADVEKQHKAD